MPLTVHILLTRMQHSCMFDSNGHMTAISCQIEGGFEHLGCIMHVIC